jgi:hypothetical protein
MAADPGLVAEAFARDQSAAGRAFDFSRDSLLGSVDGFIQACLGQRSDDPAQWKLEAALEAYVGETLRRVYDGIWQGEFRDDNPGPNFYCSWVEFGSYRYFPSHFIGYRISNGPGEGTFAEHLQRIVPRILARAQAS